MLICLMGNSGVGKDTVLKALLKSASNCNMDNIKQLVTVTDRPIRESERFSQHGDLYRPYRFLEEDTFENFRMIKLFVECRSYEVNQPKRKFWHYGTFKCDLQKAMRSKDIYLVTCTPEQFTNYYKYAEALYETHLLYPVYITVSSERERLMRSINRINENDIDGIREVCRRFCQDKEYIDTSLVPERFVVYNDDLPFSVGCIFNLIDTFNTESDKDWENDPWVAESKNHSTFGTLLRL